MTTSNERLPESAGDRQQKGRPLDRSRDPAILAAALEVLSECGYDRLTMDLVAARARQRF